MSEFATTECGTMFSKHFFFFTVEGPMVFCYDINGLFMGLKQEHGLSDWRLSIDAS